MDDLVIPNDIIMLIAVKYVQFDVLKNFLQTSKFYNDAIKKHKYNQCSANGMFYE